MTIDLSFFHRGKLVVRANMTAANFYDKVCEKIMDDEAVGEEAMDVDYAKTGEEAYTDKGKKYEL